MRQYLFRRLLAMLPTLLGITIITFGLIQIVPGGPVESALQRLRFGGGAGGGDASLEVTDELREQLERQYGFDKPVVQRYLDWVGSILQGDFGESYAYDGQPVLALVLERLPVSLTFGVFNFIFVYLISIPLGIRKAVRAGSRFDTSTSLIIFVMYSIPPFALGILFIVFLCGGSFLDWFPLQGLSSRGWEDFSWWEKIVDYLHHAFLPLVCYIIGNFALVTMLMKNSLLEQLRQDYQRTARAKGLTDRQVVYGHCLRNALIPIATGLGSYIGLFLAGSLLIEQVFGLEGIGLLSYESLMARDYPVVLAIIFLGAVATLVGNLLSDILYVLIDPRIDYA